MRNLLNVLKVFYRFISRKRFWFIVFVSSVMLSSALISIIPYFFKLLVDNIERQNYQYLPILLFTLIAIRFISLIVETLSYYLGDLVAFDAVTNTREKIFKHLQDLDFTFHTEKSTGYLISVMKRGSGAIWAFHHSIHHRFLRILVGFTVMVYYFNQIDHRISLIAILSFIIAIIVTRLLVKLNINARRQHNDEEDKVSSIVVDNLVNFETVKLFSKENWELARLKKAFIPWLNTGWKYVNTFRVIDITIGSLINISILFILIFGLNLVEKSNLTIGNFVLIVGFVNNIYPRLFDVVWSLRDVGKNYSDIEKYFGLLDYQIEVKDPISPITIKNIAGEIQFKNVSFSYKEGKKNAVKNITLNIRQGQSVAFVGRSGSGKTTLIKLLMRFYDVDKGKILLDDVDIKKLTKAHLRSFMGVVPQEPVLFNNTIRYNVGYSDSKATKKQIISAAKIANLHDFIESLPKKYNTQVGERGIKLSGGQKQRLAIARMVLSDPDIIIFDEATSQLDSENEKLIADALWKVAKNKTTIIIAHRLSTAMRADKIVVMENGKIIESGSHNSLINKAESLYKYFWNLQINIV